MKIERIAVLMDTDPESVQALEEIIPIARHLGAAIVLAHVGAVFEGYPDIKRLDADSAAALTEARTKETLEIREFLADVRQRHLGQGVDLSVSLVPGTASRSVSAIDDELAPDLIVVGSHGRTGVRRMLAGSVSERVVRRSRNTVLVARNPPTRLPYQRILVATDFSEAAANALEAALLLASPSAEVTLFHAWQLPSAANGVNPLLGKLANSIESVAQREMERLVRAQEESFVLRTEIAYGVPISLLRERANEHDLVALGNQGHDGVRRFVLGSVAELVVRHAQCSVLVAHARPDEEAATS